MNRYVMLLFALVLATAGLIWGVASRPPVPPTIPQSVRPSPPLAQYPEHNRAITSSQPANTPPPTPDAKPGSEETDSVPFLISDPEKAKARVRQLAATFDEAHVAELARYLNHPSADVRGAALEGLVLIGDSSAVPMLSAAAEVAEKDPTKGTEAVALREAAKLLANPEKGMERMPKQPLSMTPEIQVRNPLETANTASSRLKSP